MEQMKVGIIGAGRIAANMAKTLDGMDDAAAYAVAARNLDRAQKFAKEIQELHTNNFHKCKWSISK